MKHEKYFHQSAQENCNDVQLNILINTVIVSLKVQLKRKIDV